MGVKHVIQIGQILKTVGRKTLPLVKPDTWVNGACYMFALAVQKAFDGDIMAICSRDHYRHELLFPVEHFVVLKQGYLLDATGATIVSTYLIQDKEKYGSPVYLKKPTSQGVWTGDHRYEEEIVEQVVALFKEECEKYE